MTVSADPCVLLFATEPGLLPRLHVLADDIADLPHAPATMVAGPGDLPPVEELFDSRSVALVVLAGDALPTPLIDAARQRQVPLLLIEADTPAALGRRRLIPGTTRALLHGFVEIHARSAVAAAALSRLLRGEVRVCETGPLAPYLPAPGCNTQELESLRGTLGARPVWFAQALPAEEVEAVLLAHAHALRRAHRLLLIAQPGDPLQGAALAARARDVGFACARRQRDDDITETTQVYVADSEDDPGLFLRLAPVTYLGGSLTPGLGSPPALAAAELGSALVVGPQVDPGQARFLADLVARGGARRIGVAEALGEALSAFLSPEAGADAALRAWELVTEGSAATHTVARSVVDLVHKRGGAA